MSRLILVACLMLAGCSRDPAYPPQQTIDYDANIAAPAALSPGTVPIRIGEAGPNFDACSTVGAVVNLSPGGESYLALRAAPFVEAAEVARLANGTRLFVCSRSIGQKWQGVVVPPEDRPDLDCGVSSPVATARDYAGPCRSGWVSSAFVRLVAG